MVIYFHGNGRRGLFIQRERFLIVVNFTGMNRKKLFSREGLKEAVISLPKKRQRQLLSQEIMKVETIFTAIEKRIKTGTVNKQMENWVVYKSFLW